MATTNTDRFNGKVAFITGAGSGIGRTTALAFAAEGASVAAAGIAEADVVETVRLIEENGGRGLALTCDVTQETDVKAALDKTVEAFGRLDVAFNNAGVEQSKTPTAELTTEEWHRIIGVNLTGVFLCMKHQIPLMSAAGGAIVNTSSGAGVIGIAGQAGYAAAKWGVIGMSKSAALENAATQHPHQRRLPRHHRHPDDGPLHRRHRRGTRRRRSPWSPSGAWAAPKRSPQRCSGCAPTWAASPSATPWSSTAARRSGERQASRRTPQKGSLMTVQTWHVGGERRAIGDIAPKLAALTDDVSSATSGTDQTSPRDRSLITLTALMAGGHSDQVPHHLNRALENGVTQTETLETITHLAFYTGWPKAMTAVAISRDAAPRS